MSIKDVALQPSLAVTGQLEMFKSCSSHFIPMCQATATAVFWALSSTERREAQGNKKKICKSVLSDVTMGSETPAKPLTCL